MLDALVQGAKRLEPFQLPAVILHETPTEQILDETVDNLLNMHMHVIESALEACLRRTIESSYFYNQVEDRSCVYVVGTEEKDVERWDYVIPEIFFAPMVWVPTKAQLYEWHTWLGSCYDRGEEVPDLEYYAETIDGWTFFRVKEVLRDIYAHAEKLHKGFAPLSTVVETRGREVVKIAIDKKRREESVARNTIDVLVNSDAPPFVIDEYNRKLFQIKAVIKKLRSHHG
jgi:hypothetical protein